MSFLVILHCFLFLLFYSTCSRGGARVWFSARYRTVHTYTLTVRCGGESAGGEGGMGEAQLGPTRGASLGPTLGPSGGPFSPPHPPPPTPTPTPPNTMRNRVSQFILFRPASVIPLENRAREETRLCLIEFVIVRLGDLCEISAIISLLHPKHNQANAFVSISLATSPLSPPPVSIYFNALA